MHQPLNVADLSLIVPEKPKTETPASVSVVYKPAPRGYRHSKVTIPATIAKHLEFQTSRKFLHQDVEFDAKKNKLSQISEIINFDLLKLNSYMPLPTKRELSNPKSSFHQNSPTKRRFTPLPQQDNHSGKHQYLVPKRSASVPRLTRTAA